MNSHPAGRAAARLILRGRSLWREHAEEFAQERVVLWPHLSRAASLLIMLNVSLFFLQGVARCGGNYWPVKSLGLLALLEVGMLWPLGWLRGLAGYVALAALWLAAAGYFAAAIRFWLVAA